MASFALAIDGIANAIAASAARTYEKLFMEFLSPSLSASGCGHPINLSTAAVVENTRIMNERSATARPRAQPGVTPMTLSLHGGARRLAGAALDRRSPHGGRRTNVTGGLRIGARFPSQIPFHETADACGLRPALHDIANGFARIDHYARRPHSLVTTRPNDSRWFLRWDLGAFFSSFRAQPSAPSRL